MTKQDLLNILRDGLYMQEEEGELSINNCISFEDYCMITNDIGIVLETAGKKFHIVIKEV